MLLVRSFWIFSVNMRQWRKKNDVGEKTLNCFWLMCVVVSISFDTERTKEKGFTFHLRENPRTENVLHVTIIRFDSHHFVKVVKINENNKYDVYSYNKFNQEKNKSQLLVWVTEKDTPVFRSYWTFFSRYLSIQNKFFSSMKTKFYRIVWSSDTFFIHWDLSPNSFFVYLSWWSF